MVLCLDVGPTMHQQGRAGLASKLDEARSAFSMFVQQKVRAPLATRARAQDGPRADRTDGERGRGRETRPKVMDGKKTEQVGLVLFGSDRASRRAARGLGVAARRAHGARRGPRVRARTRATLGAAHPYAEEGQYPNVMVRNEIDVADINMIRFLEEQVQRENGKADCTLAGPSGPMQLWTLAEHRTAPSAVPVPDRTVFS